MAELQNSQGCEYKIRGKCYLDIIEIWVIICNTRSLKKGKWRLKGGDSILSPVRQMSQIWQKAKTGIKKSLWRIYRQVSTNTH